MAEGGAYGPQKVVYHFNSGDAQVFQLGLGNLENHYKVVAPGSLAAVMLIHAGAWVHVMKDRAGEVTREKLPALVAKGLSVRLCRVTAQVNGIDPDRDLVVPVTVVPSGVGELSQLQLQGYAYIKP